MSRPRKKDRHLPPCVHHRHGAYYLVKAGKWERLGTELSQALAEYGSRMSAPIGSLGSLIDDALRVMKPKVKPNTWKQYDCAGRKLKHMLADFSPSQVLPKHVAQLKRSLSSTPNMANRCLTVLRLVFDYALEEQLVDSNPAVGIKRLEEGKRERLVTLAEFQRIHCVAAPRLQSVMELLFLTGQRVMDVLGIKRSDIGEEGIYFRQAKTGKQLLVRWSPELREAVKKASELHGNVKALTLFHNRKGKIPDYSSIHWQWDRAITLAGLPDTDLRDLRAMAATATKKQDKNATALLGHTSASMTARYLRDKEIPQVDGPSFGHILDVGQKGAKN